MRRSAMSSRMLGGVARAEARRSLAALAVESSRGATETRREDVGGNGDISGADRGKDGVVGVSGRMVGETGETGFSCGGVETGRGAEEGDVEMEGTEEGCSTAGCTSGAGEGVAWSGVGKMFWTTGVSRDEGGVSGAERFSRVVVIVGGVEKARATMSSAGMDTVGAGRDGVSQEISRGFKSLEARAKSSATACNQSAGRGDGEPAGLTLERGCMGIVSIGAGLEG